MPAETRPASATACTTLHLHDRFLCALQRPLDRSIRGLLGPYDMRICRCAPASVVATGHGQATRSDRGGRRASSRPCRRYGRQAVCAGRDWRRHVFLLVLTVEALRHPYLPSCPFCTYIRNRISDLLLPIRDLLSLVVGRSNHTATVPTRGTSLSPRL
jgi:hypothetical protein